jgi:hypothetical protein
MPIQETERLSFGSARLYGTDADGNALMYGELNDIQIDLKTELKEAWGEGNYSFAVADSHRSIDISAKHYLLDMPSLADSIGGAQPVANTVGYVVDELGTVGASSPYSYTLEQTSPITLLSVVEGITVNGVIVPVYLEVTTGAPTAGESYTISGDVLKFASGDAGNPLKITYSYTVESTGTEVTVVEQFQNSQPFMTLTCIRRDASQLDGSTGIQVWEFARVRDAGIKVPYKEGDYAIYERSFKAFASPWGTVLTVRAFNE